MLCMQQKRVIIKSLPGGTYSVGKGSPEEGEQFSVIYQLEILVSIMASTTISGIY